MPVITIDMHKAETEVKEELIKGVTAAAVNATKISESSFTVLINELDDVNIGLGGKTLREIKSMH